MGGWNSGHKLARSMAGYLEIWFSDDGKVLSGASIAVLVVIDLSEKVMRKEAWLVVTGLMAEGMACMRDGL